MDGIEGIGKEGEGRGDLNALIDPIHVILGLDRHARALAHLGRGVQPLRALEAGGAVHPVARVDDDAGLVGAELGLDAREGAGDCAHDGAPRRVVDQEVAVVALARAVGAAVARELGVVARVAQEQARLAREVVDAVRRGRADLARRQRALVRLEEALRVRQVQRVVPDLLGGGVLVGVEVEVRVLREHERWWPRRKGLATVLFLGLDRTRKREMGMGASAYGFGSRETTPPS